MLRSSLAGFLALGLLLTALPASAQVNPTDWTPRPDAFAPSGVFADRLIPAGVLDARVRFTHHSFKDLLVGRNEISPVVISQDWDLIPVQAERQEVSVELGMGLNSWMAVMGRIPFVRSQAQFENLQAVGTTSASGVGDPEAHLLVGLHDTWPVRAHLSLGASIPVGSTDQRGVIMGQSESVLPYAFQPGAGTVAILPGATLVTENPYGTVGFQLAGRYHVDENDRDWAPGDELSANLFMQYRFNDWMGGSIRLAYTRVGAITGVDAGLDPFVSPLHTALATGGTHFQVPVGLNIHFAEGALQGNRIQAELLIPAHSDLNGPQLRRSWGASVSWGLQLGGDRNQVRADQARAPIERDPVPMRATVDPPPDREDPRAQGTPTPLCLATGETLTVYVTAQGETLVGPDRLTIEEAGGAQVVFPGNYAELENWFIDDEPVRFEERDYLRSGSEHAVECDNLVRVGDFRTIPLYVTVGSERPFEALYVPTRPGVWQLYRTDLARVRG